MHWLFYVLKSVCYPEDEASLMQALCDKQYGEGWTQKKAAKELEKARMEEKEAGLRKNSNLLERILCLQEEGTDAKKTENWKETLLTQLHLEEQILPTSASYQKDMNDVKQMLDSLGRMDIQNQGLGACLNQLALSGMQLYEQEAEQSDAVKLMTLHASKGLEFDYVFLIGVNYGLIPLLSGGMESEEEERRLFFVGMTRAKEYLELSYYTSPDGPRVMPGPGRFLRLLPERLVEAPEDFREQRRDRGSAQAHLQDIKKQIEQARQKENVQVTESASMEQVGSRESVAVDTTARSRRVRHAKYGIGEIVEEKEMQIVVDFPDYGKKEFIRQFAPLEYLDT